MNYLDPQVTTAYKVIPFELYDTTLKVYWLPRDVVISDETIELAMFPEDYRRAQAIVAEVKRKEFIRSRWLVREAAGEKFLLPSTEDGAPLWPDHLAGSLSHTSGHVVVAVLKRGEYRGVGVDIERISRMKTDLEPRIMTPGEILLVNELMSFPKKGKRNREFWLAVFFSFKEACYKCFCPLIGKRFFFHDVAVHSIDLATQMIKAGPTEGLRENFGNTSDVLGCYKFLDHPDGPFIVTSVVALNQT